MGRPNTHNLPEHLRKIEKEGARDRFYLDYYITQEGGKKKRVREDLGYISMTQAKAERDRRIAELAKHDFKVLPPKANFKIAAEAYLAHCKARERRSYSRAVMLVDRMVAHFGEMPLENLTPSALESFLNILKEQGKRCSFPAGVKPVWKPYKPATLNRYIACAKTIVNLALTNRLLDRNTLHGMKLFKENNARDRVLTQDEYHLLLDQCSPHLKAIVKLAYLTGMRQGEILKLRWDQVNTKDGVIRLASADTKTAQAREVPLDARLLEDLTALPRHLRSQFVFTYEGLGIGSIKTAFKAACTRADINDFRFHDLRHCAVTNLRKAGVPTGTIMSISGHKTDAMMRRYDRVDQEDRKAALERVRHFLDTGPKDMQKTA